MQKLTKAEHETLVSIKGEHYPERVEMIIAVGNTMRYAACIDPESEAWFLINNLPAELMDKLKSFEMGLDPNSLTFLETVNALILDCEFSEWYRANMPPLTAAKIEEVKKSLKFLEEEGFVWDDAKLGYFLPDNRSEMGEES
jgi:hypothetical protein